MAHQESPVNSSLSNLISDVRTTARQSLSPLRHRPLGRASTFADNLSPLRHRRSSNFSDSVDSARQSIKSSTDNLLLPKAKSPDVLTSHEPSHWHSIPLVLALLPAAGGLFHEGGSALITDVTLLGLAAIFLNWSVRSPWDWYHSAQKTQIQEPYPQNISCNSDTIIEEGSEEEHSQSPLATPAAEDLDCPPKEGQPTSSQKSAVSELRVYELLAFLSCFLGPLIGASLLHAIRGQLSRPSEGLVSNYNLTIFLLASELRPFAHLIKLAQSRTLYLQRTIATDPHQSSPTATPAALKDLTTRLAELENHVANSISIKQISPPDVTAQARKTIQPDLDALNRAVRRYEKRATLLAMQTETRLQDLEGRLGDAITLAAAAERTSQSNRQRRGSGVGLLVDWMATAMLLPVQVGWAVISLPGKAMGTVFGYVEEIVGKKVQKEMKTAGRIGGAGEKRKIQGRGQKKVM